MPACLLVTFFFILSIALRSMPTPPIWGSVAYAETFGRILLEVFCFLSTGLILKNIGNFTKSSSDAATGAIKLFIYGFASLQSILLLSTFVNLPFSLASTDALLNYDEATVIASDEAVFIDGTIGPKTIDRLLSIDAQKNIRAITVRSNGGLINEAVAISNLVKSRKLHVHVIDYCSSACTIIASASPFLTASPRSTFGFHQGTTIADYESSLSKYLSQEATTEMLEELRRNGIPSEIIKAALETAPNQMHYVSAERMLALGVVKAIRN